MKRYIKLILSIILFSCASTSKVPNISTYISKSEIKSLTIFLKKKNDIGDLVINFGKRETKEKINIESIEKINQILNLLFQYNDAGLSKSPKRLLIELEKKDDSKLELYLFDNIVSIKNTYYKYEFNIEKKILELVK